MHRRCAGSSRSRSHASVSVSAPWMRRLFIAWLIGLEIIDGN